MPSTAATLSQMNRRLSAIEEHLSLGVPVVELRQALTDILETLGQLAQLREIYATQRDSVAALVIIANVLLGEERAHDARGTVERETIQALLLQLRELGRKHVSGLYDIERAIGGGLTDDERARAEGEGD